ncbi:YARHG domain-containing protein [Archangium sp.]|jgi:hypothetical protein|uniref:YARHG domain-containing protein n=1 Tax=Archangium sp. TaxID=1872627 RepID=UPI002EDA1FDA
MRILVLATTLALSGSALAQEPPAEYVPAPAKEIPGYSETKLPCKFERGIKDSRGWVSPAEDEDPDAADFVECDSPHRGLGELPLRELSILRNTIYARYGWAGFRKPWLREHFLAQPWYKPDPKFSLKRLSKVDHENAELLAKVELSLRYVDLEKRRDKVLARVGKWWGDLPFYEGKRGKQVHACDLEGYTGPTERRVGEVGSDDTHMETLSWVTYFRRAVGESKDCLYHGDERAEVKKHQHNEPVAPDLRRLSPEDRIELGLISRAMGDFAVDEGQREQISNSLDEVLKVKDLRLLSLRDLRFLRNTIYARRGRPFKSELLQQHFAHMPWYQADKAYSDARLTKTDKRNIDLIRAVEKEFGGALGDKDFHVGNPSSATDIPYHEPQY